MNKSILLLATLLAGSAGLVRGQVLPFSYYTTDSEVNALPSAEVHKVYQDAQGFLWMAVFSSGMVRYDGHRMELYGIEDGLRDVAVWDVREDAAGRLWVASNGGLSVSEEPLAAYNTGRRIRFSTVLENLPLLDVAVTYNRMALDLDGWLWVGTDALGIVRYRAIQGQPLEADTLRVPAMDGSGENALVRALAVRRDGSVWVALAGGSIRRFERGSRVPAPVAGSGSVSEATTNTLYETADGVLWGGRQNGEVWRLEEGRAGQRFVTVTRTLTVNISSMLVLRSGEIWVGSEGGGILEIDPARPTASRQITRASGLLSETVYHLMQDREGNVWVSQTGGVAKLRHNYAAFENITTQALPDAPAALPAPSVSAVVVGGVGEDPCRLWAAPQDAGLTCIPPEGASAEIRQADGLWSDWVLGMARDRQGRLWVGTLRGINVLAFGTTPLPPGIRRQQSIQVLGRPARVAGYGLSYSILSVSTDLLPSEQGSAQGLEVVLFPAYHILFALVNDEWFEMGPEAGLPQAVLHAAAIGPDGRLWVGSRDQGLYRSTQPVTLARLRAHTIGQAESAGAAGLTFEQVWSVATGAPSNQIETLHREGGDLWVGTPEGLVSLDPATLRVQAFLTREKGMPANNAVSLARSPSTGHLWVGTNGGLAEVNPDARTVVRTVTKQDGLVDNEVWFYGSVAASSDGTIYYGTAKGIAIYHPARDAGNTTPPVLHLTGFEQHRSATGRNEISFEYAGLSFASERQVRYRTRLLGYDAQWSEPIADTRLRFTNLPAFFVPKKYTFEVMAANESGVWTETPLRHTFFVSPRPWLTWWAFLGYAVLLGLAVFGVDRVQRRRLIRQERQRSHEREQALKLEAAEAWATYLNAENERKTAELESARRLQLSMLPEKVPEHPSVHIAAYMCTATEVGGDYYDFHAAGNGTLTIAIGDATGHGAAAGTVVTATKGLFMLLAGEASLETIVRRATRALRQMRFRSMYMSMGLVRIHDHTMEFVGAGMPPALLYRKATQRVEAIALKGMPLGGSLHYPYHTETIGVETGDVLLLMTDGLAELFNGAHQMLGYDRVQELFARVADRSPEEVIRFLMTSAADWLGYELQGGEVPDRELGNQDDITFVVLKVR